MRSGRKDILMLAVIAAAAFLVHGYHPYSEDAETYLPGIERVLNPHLFPIGSEYFQMHAHLTWFPELIAGSVRLLHLSLPWALFLWQITTFFLFLLACWTLMRHIYPQRAACWGGVVLVAALFTMPVAGTALYLMDPFVNPRNITAFAEILAVLTTLRRQYWAGALSLLFAGSIHPLMTAFSCSFCALLVVMDRLPEWWGKKRELREAPAQENSASLVPAGVAIASVDGIFDAPTQAYDHVAESHRYQFLTRWTWYEMLGAIAPIFIFMGFSSFAKRRGMRALDLLARTMAVYATIYFFVGLIVSIPHRLEVFALLQPMRSLWIVYVVMLLIGGGLLGEYVLRNRAWRWICLFLPLAGGMCWAQRTLYPASPHIEWPSRVSSNPWFQAFYWVRNNTPQQAIFALDPGYMNQPGEDSNGFRAIAERSQLADALKDGGVVEMFPNLGASWARQVQAQTGIEHFSRADLERLKTEFNVSWVVLHTAYRSDIECPYQNTVVMVCRIP